MTAKELLSRINAGQLPTGVPDRMGWRWTLDGESVTRAVNTLRRAGKVNITWHRQFASISAA